jgi:hypothetical protein
MYTRILLSSPHWAPILREMYLVCLCVPIPCLFSVNVMQLAHLPLRLHGTFFASLLYPSRTFFVHLPSSFHLSAMNHNHTSKA